MATPTISEECIACGACASDCPVEAISEGDNYIYVIDAGLCVECSGYYETNNCVASCPMEAIAAN